MTYSLIIIAILSRTDMIQELMADVRVKVGVTVRKGEELEGILHLTFSH
jgi:hypothetical protein